MNHNIKLGTYKHYKGHTYTVLGVAIHSEDSSEIVIYTRMDEGNEQLLACPIKMFLENVTTGDYTGPRFEYIEE